MQHHAHILLQPVGFLFADNTSKVTEGGAMEEAANNVQHLLETWEAIP